MLGYGVGAIDFGKGTTSGVERVLLDPTSGGVDILFSQVRLGRGGGVVGVSGTRGRGPLCRGLPVNRGSWLSHEFFLYAFLEIVANFERTSKVVGQVQVLMSKIGSGA